MPVPSDIPSLSVTPSGNSPTGTESPTTTDDYLRTLFAFLKQTVSSGSNIASAASINPPSTGSSFNVTGTTTTTGISSANSWDGRLVMFTATGAWPLTHSATLILPGATNLTMAAGDTIMFRQESSGVWRCVMFNRAAGLTLASLGYIDYLNSTRIDVASASTVNLTSSAPNTRSINITGTTTIGAFTVAAGQLYFVRFNAALTLTNSASLVTQTGADLLTEAGATAIIRATAANTVEVLCYTGSATTTQKGVVELATSAEAAAGTDATRALTPSTLRGGLIVSTGWLATTSGTSQTLSSIPSWVRNIDILLAGTSTTGTSNYQVQIGDAGGLESTGYLSGASTLGGSATPASGTAGFLITANSTAATIASGILRLTSADGITWVESGALGISTGGTHVSGGSKTLSPGPLTQISLGTVGGTDTFDAGQWAVNYW
jgi:hypothetical protein